MLFIGCQPDKGEVGVDHTIKKQYQPEVINPDYNGVTFLPNGSVLIWGTDGAILHSENNKEWKPVHYRSDSAIYSMASNTSGKKVMAVGEQGTLLFSSDGGKNWYTENTQRHKDLPNVNYNSVAYVPVSNTWIIVADDGYVLSSRDDSNHWEVDQLESKIHLATVKTLDDNKTILLGGEHGVMASSLDAGKNWSIQKAEIDARITTFHQFNKYLIGLTNQGYFLFSDSLGKKWQTIQLPDKTVATSSAVFDSVRRILLVGTANGVIIRSDDAGKNWEVTSLKYEGQAFGINSILFDQKNKKMWLSGQLGVIGASSDGGVSWELERVLNSWSSQHMYLDNHYNNKFISIGPGGMLLTASNNGKGINSLPWNKVRGNLMGYYREGVILDEGRIVVLGTVGEVVSSTNDDWHKVEITYPNPQTPPNYRALALSPDKGQLVAAGPTGAVLTSKDQGESWQPALWTPFKDNEAFTQILVDKNRKRMVAVEAQGRFYVSDDDGKSWKPRFFKLKHAVWHGAVSEKSGVMVAVGEAGSIAVSQNSGMDWAVVETPVSMDLYGVYYSPEYERFFAVGQKGTLLYSNAKGKDWQTVARPVSSDLRRMVASASGTTLFAFGANQVILCSTNGGKSWKTVSDDGTSELRAALLEPGTDRILITGSEGMLLRSEDNGKKWQQIATGTRAHFRNLAANRKSGNLILMGERLVELKVSQPNP